MNANAVCIQVGIDAMPEAGKGETVRSANDEGCQGQGVS
jgi:hypothetical protein